MKAEIIPAILVNSFQEFRQKAETVENYVNWVQLDVADGDFAPSTAWGDPVALHDYDPGVFIETHLMVAEPERVIDDWLTGRAEEKDSGVKRFYFHYEATAKHKEVIQKIKEAGKEAGIAILPDTPLSNIKLLDELVDPVRSREGPQRASTSYGVDAVLIFSGDLGYYGGGFREEPTLSKIRALRQTHPHLTIEVDGGMNPETAPKAVQAGANAIVSGSYIWNSEDPKKAIDKLRSAISHKP